MAVRAYSLDSGQQSFTASGSGTPRAVSAALDAVARTGDHSSVANFNTRTDALTETIGIHSIQGPAAGLQLKFPTNQYATNSSIITLVPYEFGMKLGLAGSGQNHDNRFELYLGSADSSAAEFSVRHNGNNTGAIIQARNAGDTDGIFLDFTDSTYPWVRWGNNGPYLVKETTGILNIRNPATVGEAQRLYIANTWTPAGSKEYLQLGFESGTNRGVCRVSGAGGGTQRPLDLDGSEIQLQTGGSLRAFLNPGGFFKASPAGTFLDSAGAFHEIRSPTGSDWVTRFAHTHATNPNGLVCNFSAAAPDDNTQKFLQFFDTLDTRLIVYSDGDVQNHDNSYGAISDERLKQDIVDAGSQWADLKNLRVRKYRLKSDVSAGKDHVQIGLIAQEVSLVSPGLVTHNPESDKYGVQYSVLYMKAVKCLQEAMARIETLEAQVASLST